MHMQVYSDTPAGDRWKLRSESKQRQVKRAERKKGGGCDDNGA